MQKFEKKERLSKKRYINNLFKEGNSFNEYPFRIIWKMIDKCSEQPIQTIMLVSKKYVPKAYLRNKIKRWMRESYRKNKKELYEKTKQENKAIHVAFIYQKQEIKQFPIIEEKIKLVLLRLTQKL